MPIGIYKRTEKHKKIMSESHKGYKMPKEQKIKISNSIKGKNKGKKYPQFSGENSCHWTGENIGYSGIHTWVKKWKGQPNLCENCGSTKAKKFEWANIDHKYRRILEDYIRLCTKCHRSYDRDILKIKVGR